MPGVVSVALVSMAFALCYKQSLVARGVLWFVPAAIVAVVYRDRLPSLRISGTLLALVGWVTLCTVVAGVPKGTFMLLLLYGAIAAGTALGGVGIRACGRGLLAASTAICFVSVALVMLHWKHAVDHTVLYKGSWQGVFNQKNVLGWNAALLVALTAAQFRDLRRRRAVALLMLGTIALWGSRSAGAAGALGFALVFMFGAWVLRKRGKQLRWRHTVLMLTLLLVGAGIVFPAVIGTFRRDPTLTGRTVMWTSFWHDAKTDLMLGHGVGAYWFRSDSQPTLDALERKLHFRPGQAHNGALDVVLDAGIPGLTLLGALALAALRRAVRAYQYGTSWPLIVLLFGFSSTMSERGFYSAPMLLITAMVLSAPSV